MNKRIVLLVVVLIILVVFLMWPNRKSFMENKRVAYISAIFGNYETTCKVYKDQTINSDFIMFTDNSNIERNNWKLDTKPYHVDYPNYLDDGKCHNSLQKNKHTFNIAKYYKQSFHLIPILKEDYDIVVWIDGTIEIIDENFTNFIIDKFKNGYDMISVNHTERKNLLKNEVDASHTERYTSTHWNGQDQPFQDVDSQYKHYINDGYRDDEENSNVWITCLVAFDMNNPKTVNFLEFWYEQTLKFTTQDQISFPYCVQKMNMNVFTIEENNTIFIKHSHGK